MHLISLSTIPSRFGKLDRTLNLLLNQSSRPDHIILYIPRTYRRFPDYDGHLPQVPKGVEIRVVDEDFGPATKVLHACRDFAGTDTEILFCDDDMLYPRHWAAAFLKERRHAPEACLAICGFQISRLIDSDGMRDAQPRALRSWRITDVENHLRQYVRNIQQRWFGRTPTLLGRRINLRSGYIDCFEGFGGVMVRPDFFDERAFDIPEVLWAVDDIWLSGMATANHHPVWAIGRMREPEPHPLFIENALHNAVIDGADRGQANRAAATYLRETYGIWS